MCITLNKFIKSLFSRSTDSAIAFEVSTPSGSQTEYAFQHHRLYYDGLIQLQIVNRTGANVQLLSQFELLGSRNCELILVEWLDDEQFIAMDSMGRIYSAVFSSGINRLQTDNSSKKSLTALTSLELYPTKDACFSHGKLWLTGAKQGGRASDKSLYCVDIALAHKRAMSRVVQDKDALNIVSTDISHYKLPFRFVSGSMVCVADNEFVFYQREKRRVHQLVSFNPLTSETTVHPLEGKPAPTEISFRSTFFMDNQRGIALLANAETVSFAEHVDAKSIGLSSDDAEALNFDFVLQLIDFKQKKTQWSRSVRALNPSQICAKYQADELVESLSAIAAGDTSSSHHDELQTFIECLTSAGVAADGKSIWLGWQDGMVQQLSLTGECIAPLHQLMQRNSKGELRKLLVFEHEPVMVQAQIDSQLIVAVGEEEDARIWSMDLANKQLGSSASLVQSYSGCSTDTRNHQCIVPVVCQPQAFSLDIPARLTEVPALSGQVDIFCQDINCTSARQVSLERLSGLMPKLQIHYEGLNENDLSPVNPRQQSLFFSFVSQRVSGCSAQSEYDLFATAGYDEKGAALLASIIKQFAGWRGAALFSGLKGAPVMADAVLALADKSEYLDVLAEYFCAIGGQEPIHPFHVHRTMAVIREQHAETPELTAFMEKVPWPWNDVSFTVANVDDYH